MSLEIRKLPNLLPIIFNNIYEYQREISTIHHIAIIVSNYSNYEKAKDFYVKKLGFEVIRENYRPQKEDWKLVDLDI